MLEEFEIIPGSFAFEAEGITAAGSDFQSMSLQFTHSLIQW